MQERASVFFALLNEMYKLDASEKLELITIVSFPHMESHNASDIIANYQKISRDILELTEDDNDYSNITKLKDAL